MNWGGSIKNNWVKDLGGNDLWLIMLFLDLNGIVIHFRLEYEL